MLLVDFCTFTTCLFNVCALCFYALQEQHDAAEKKAASELYRDLAGLQLESDRNICESKALSEVRRALPGALCIPSLRPPFSWVSRKAHVGHLVHVLLRREPSSFYFGCTPL